MKSLLMKSLPLSLCSASLVVQLVKNPCRAGDSSLIPGSGRSLGEGKGNPLQFLAWKIPQTEAPDRLQSMGSQKSQSELRDETTTHHLYVHNENSLVSVRYCLCLIPRAHHSSSPMKQILRYPL